jgi:ribosomal protein S18 acetylase RimI-like enzyme
MTIETTRTRLKLTTRPMTAKDIKDVSRISFACFADSWLENKFVQMQDVLDFQVVTNRGGVIGYSCHQDCDDHIRIINFGVIPKLRRAGAGKALMDRLKFFGKPLEIILSERNLFETLRDEFGVDDDGLVFQF